MSGHTPRLWLVSQTALVPVWNLPISCNVGMEWVDFQAVWQWMAVTRDFMPTPPPSPPSIEAGGLAIFTSGDAAA